MSEIESKVYMDPLKNGPPGGPRQRPEIPGFSSKWAIFKPVFLESYCELSVDTQAQETSLLGYQTVQTDFHLTPSALR